MKIALSIKKEVKDNIIKELKLRKFEYDINGFGDVWIYDLRLVKLYSIDSISIENNKFDYMIIKLSDLEHFEVHN